MKYRVLGQMETKVSVVCMGCWSISTKDRFWEQQTRPDSLAAIRASFESGINFFDTAPAYGDGESEELLSEALGSHRDEVVIATKIGPADLDSERVIQCCEESLRRLKTDHIDLYQIHWPNGSLPLEPTMRALESLKKQGKIRAIGVSNFGRSYLDEARQHADIVTNQVPYNLLWRAIEYEILPNCTAHGTGILCYSPLSQGLLTGKFRSADAVPERRARTRLFRDSRPLSRHGEPGYEEELFAAVTDLVTIAESAGAPLGSLSLAWLLRQPGVAAVVCGARSAAQATENARAAEFELDDRVMLELTQATEKIKQLVGPNADMWETPSRMDRAE